MVDCNLISVSGSLQTAHLDNCFLHVLLACVHVRFHIVRQIVRCVRDRRLNGDAWVQCVIEQANNWSRPCVAVEEVTDAIRA